MKKIWKTGLMISVSISLLAGCSGNIPSIPGGDYSGNLFQVRDNGTGNPTQPGAGFGGKHGKPGKEGFGLPVELNLTDEQKSQLEALKPEKPAEQPDKTKMEEVRKAINDAFISDNFDVTALKAKLEANAPADKEDHVTAEAQRIVTLYNILTPEQRTILETKQAEIASKTPPEKPMPDMAEKDTARFDKLATDLGLTDAQKTSLKEAMQPPARPDQNEMIAKRKAVQEAVNNALKGGNATVDSISSILKSNAPSDLKKDDGIDRLAKIHAILNAEQRAKFIEMETKAPGFGGHGGKMGHHPGFPGK